MQKINIAIDGPAGSGKGTTAKLLAKKLGYYFLDTGAMYRAFAYAMKQKEITPNTFSKHQLIGVKISFNDQNEVCLNNQSIEKSIRVPEISQLASDFSTLPEVREFLVEIQQEIVKDKGYVAEGRDIGTKVIPDAELKIYLTASVEIRAERRYQDYKKKGLLFTFDEIVKNIEERDHQDMTREYDPLIKSDDAIEVDTTNLTIEEQVEVIENLANKIIDYNQ